MTLEVAVIGTGRLAAALANALASGQRGFRLMGVHGRRPEAARALAGRVPGARALEAADIGTADVVFLAVHDAAIAEVAASLKGSVTTKRPGRLWLHGAGALGTEPLRPLAGELRAVLHPLASLPEEGTLHGQILVASGEREARERTLALGTALQGRPVWIEQLDRAAYHAAATLLANGTTALAAAGTALLDRASAGALGREAASALIDSALRPLAAASPEDTLTGPVRRGDAAVVRAHRAALQDDPDLLRLYDALMVQALTLARRSGLTAERVQAIEDALRPAP